jgi:hypothetical protein
VIQPLRINGRTFLGSVLRSIPIAFANPLNVAPRLRQIATRTVNCVTRSPLAASEESKKRVTTRETCRTLVQMQVVSIVAQAASSDTRERLVGGIGVGDGSRSFTGQFIVIKFTLLDNRAYLPMSIEDISNDLCSGGRRADGRGQADGFSMALAQLSTERGDSSSWMSWTILSRPATSFDATSPSTLSEDRCR